MDGVFHLRNVAATSHVVDLGPAQVESVIGRGGAITDQKIRFEILNHSFACRIGYQFVSATLWSLVGG